MAPPDDLSGRRDALPHLEEASSWREAEALLRFRPLEPAHTAGFRLRSLSVHVRDHKHRDLDPAHRTLEAHYGGFIVTQARPGASEARRQALHASYGPAPKAARIRGQEARVYELGPEPDPSDVDGRPPAVVSWHVGELFFLVASDQLPSSVLVRIAESLHEVGRRGRSDPRPR